MSISNEIIRTVIKEGQELLGDVEIYDRPFDFDTNSRYVLVGVRQAGKSYMLYKRAKELMSLGHIPEDFLYVDFDDERLLNFEVTDFDTLLKVYTDIYGRKPIMLLDEIQNVIGWEHFARRMANLKQKIYITGSNAKMLSREIHTVLGSRFLEARVYPYSFMEYLGAQGIILGKEWQYGSDRSIVIQQLNDYIHWGGFPELLLFTNKRKWLNQLYEKIVLGDIALRNGIKNEMGLRLTYKRIAETMTKPVSFSRLSQLINSTGFKSSPSSVMDYVKYGKESYLLFSLDNYAAKFTERESVKKYYFIDNGLLNILLPNGGESFLLENLCAIHLKRKHEESTYFYNKGIEVDFLVPDKSYAIQACWSIGDIATREREVDALIKLDRHMPLERMEIVTYEDEETLTLPNGKTVDVKPLWKWLAE